MRWPGWASPSSPSFALLPDPFLAASLWCRVRVSALRFRHHSTHCICPGALRPHRLRSPGPGSTRAVPRRRLPMEQRATPGDHHPLLHHPGGSKMASRKLWRATQSCEITSTTGGLRPLPSCGNICPPREDGAFHSRSSSSTRRRRSTEPIAGICWGFWFWGQIHRFDPPALRRSPGGLTTVNGTLTAAVGFRRGHISRQLYTPSLSSPFCASSGGRGVGPLLRCCCC